MDNRYNKYFFNEFYEKNGGGNYTNKGQWIPFFDMVAENIIENFQPKTVLDAGCACGYLVETLRKRGVEAYGIDVSEYAVGMATEEIRPYLNVQSVTERLTEKFPQKFDLVITIEVLEHLFPEDGARAIRLLCSYADTVIFTSTPTDIEDKTHVNVQQKEYWAKLFAENSFYHDLIQPVDFICKWAMLFRKQENIPSVIFQYELSRRIDQRKERNLFEAGAQRKGCVYFDCGSGFSEENKVFFTYEGAEIKTGRLEIPDSCGQVRIDPVEDKFCILRNMHIGSNLGGLDIYNTNSSEVIGDMYYFKNTDPWLCCCFEGRVVRWIEISGKILLLSDNTKLGMVEDIAASRKYRAEKVLLECQENYETRIKEGEEEKGKLIEEFEEEKRALESKQEQALSKCREEYEEKIRKQEEERKRIENEKNQALAECRERYEERVREEEAEKESLKREFEEEHKKILNKLTEEMQNRIEKNEAEKKYLLSQNAFREENLLHQNELLDQEKETFRLHYMAAIEQRENLKQELEQARQLCEDYRTSFCWKITKPIRFCVLSMKKLMMSNRAGRRFMQGIHSLRTNGIKETWKKVLLSLSKKRKLKVFGENFNLSTEKRQEQESMKFSKPITFSILVPLYNTPQKFLDEMIMSVRMQTYKNWELCLADGSDPKKGKKIEKYCRAIQRKDKRIRYRKLEKNGGISENTNACIDMSSGEYIGLFDHDDLLHPAALYEMMCAIAREKADFLYTDEATFEGSIKNIITAHFKPDYAIDTLRGNNYICHFSVFRRELLEQAGKFRKEYDGSQDHDFILRVTKEAKKIFHIQKILYYWRSHPASVAADINSKTYAIDAGKRAVQNSIESYGEKVMVESSKAFPTIYRLKYELKEEAAISILIPCRDRAEDTRRCIQSILQYSTYKNYEILIIDNASKESETFALYKELSEEPKVRILYWNNPFNYSSINNYAAKNAKGKYLILLNNDTQIIAENWMEEMLMYAQREDIGAVGAKLYYGDNTIQHAGIILGMGADGVAGHAHYRQPKENLGYMGRLYYAQNLTAVTAACMMVRKSVYEKMHGLSEEFAVAYNDVDFCMRLRRAGYLIVFTPYAELYHYESKTRGYEDNSERQNRFKNEVNLFKKKWKKELEAGDPYFNPNFDLLRDDFAVLRY